MREKGVDILLEKQNRKKEYLRAFLTSGILASAIFLVFIILGKGKFFYMGDFDAQQIPFYVHCHKFIRSGGGLWDFSTELGNNFFASYTYYTLCSPFFWLMIPFPTSWVPYLMGPMYILKFACAGLTSYIYIRYFTKTKESALFGSILYTFCGWSVFNIFYNQFHESFIIFPLLLLSLEKLVKENKRGFFAVTVALSAIVNYYFFAGMVVFTFIYWAVKSISKAWDMSFKTFGKIALEAILGVLSAMFVLIPSAIAVFSMSRTSNIISGTQFWMYDNPKLYFYIIQSMFFPAEVPSFQTFADTNDILPWQSLSLYIPLVGIIGIITFIKKNKKNWLSRLIVISFIMMLIPGLNASFTMLQNTYYARWFMMPILIGCLITAVSIENYETDEFVPAYKKVGLITLAIFLAVILTPSKETGVWKIGIWNRGEKESESIRFAIFLFFSFIAIIQLLFLFLYGRKEKCLYKNKKIMGIACILIFFVSTFTIFFGRSISGNGLENKFNENFKSAVINTDIKDNDRINNFSNYLNITLMTDKASTTFFHSIAPEGAVNTYKCLLDYGRKVHSPRDINNKYFNAITSVKYFVVDKNFVDNYEEILGEDKDFDKTVLEDYKKYGYALNENAKKKEFKMKDLDAYNLGTKSINLYENTASLSMGIEYEYYVTQSDYNKLNKEQQGRAMINALVIKDNEKEKFKDLQNYYPLIKEEKDYSNEQFLSDCQNKVTCSDYKQLKNSFTADIATEKDLYVMFSVASDNNGWKAYVDGKEAEINVVDGGFMAVKVSEGTHNIKFEYFTPGLKIGLASSAVGIVGIAILFLLSRKKRACCSLFS